MLTDETALLRQIIRKTTLKVTVVGGGGGGGGSCFGAPGSAGTAYISEFI